MLFTQREKEIIQLIKSAPTIRFLATQIGLSYRTTQHHLGKIYAKYHVKNRLELILKLIDETEDSMVI